MEPGEQIQATSGCVMVVIVVVVAVVVRARPLQSPAVDVVVVVAAATAGVFVPTLSQVALGLNINENPKWSARLFSLSCSVCLQWWPSSWLVCHEIELIFGFTSVKV